MKKVIKIDICHEHHLDGITAIFLYHPCIAGRTIAMIPVLLEFLHQQFNLQSEVGHVGGTAVLGVRDSLTVTVVAVIVAHHGQVVTCTISNMYCTADQPVSVTSPADFTSPTP